MVTPPDAWQFWIRCYWFVFAQKLDGYEEQREQFREAWSMFVGGFQTEIAKSTEYFKKLEREHSAACDELRKQKYESDAAWRKRVAEVDSRLAKVEANLAKETARANAAEDKLHRPTRQTSLYGSYERLDYVRLPLRPDECLRTSDPEAPGELVAETREQQEAIASILEHVD